MSRRACFCDQDPALQPANPYPYNDRLLYPLPALLLSIGCWISLIGWWQRPASAATWIVLWMYTPALPVCLWTTPGPLAGRLGIRPAGTRTGSRPAGEST